MYPYFQKTISAAEMPPNPLSDFLSENPAFGTLLFQVQGGQGAFPIAHAAVTLTKELQEGQLLSFTLTTDESGRTEPLSLPAPRRILSQKPGSEAVYATYQAKVTAAGYLPVTIRDLPVFDGITTIQPVRLSPDFGQNTAEGEIIEDKAPQL
ncbi:MAG: carboxypeptidase-like regulatory domain-containing protein [Bacillota bacterium]|nr:carboxypeptidase-like regulatory domain-containing protein [Bacillota bacterium]